MKIWFLSALTCCTLLNSTSFDPTIPVLDMDEYFNPTTHQQFITKLHDAMSDVGFFAVINTQIDPQILTQAYQACFDFFSLPQETKNHYYKPHLNGQRGYLPGERAKGAHTKDSKEFYHVGRELSHEELNEHSLEKNVWPEEVDLQRPLLKLFDALSQYMIPLQSAMAEALGEPEHLFSQMTQNGNILMRALHYPSHIPENGLWAGEHTDIDLFTILPRATSEGLQVKNREGQWIDVIVPDNAFIINCGDMMENITNGRFHSGLHRVVSKADTHERYSIVFFVHPRNEESLNPLPSCIEYRGKTQHYANATRLELLEERLADLGLASPAALQHLAQSGLMDRLIDVGRASPDAMQALENAGLASEKVQNALRKIAHCDE